MKKTLLVLSLVFIAGALALIWHFAGGETASAPAVVTPKGASPAPARPAQEDVANLPKASDDDTNLGRKSVDEHSGDASRTAALLADATWVDVDVRLPVGTPTDEKIELFAVVFAPDRFKDDDALDVGVSNYKSMRGEGSFGFSPRRLVPSGSDLAEELPCEAAANGRFRAPFPKGSKKGLLRLSARYAYLADPPTVEIPSSAMTLSPELGAWLTARLRLPSNLPSDVDPDKLAAFDVNLNGWKMNGEHHGELIQVTGRLDFEIGGLRSGLNYFLQGTSPQFVAFNDLQLVPQAGEHLERQYDLKVGAFISGRVVDEAGAGVAEANISVESKRQRNFFGGGNNRGAQSDAQGNFSLRAIDAGKATVHASRDGFVTGDSTELELIDGQRVENVSIVMSHGNTLAGRVVWPDGQPAVGAKVLAIEHKTKNPRRPWEDWSQKDTTADGDGRFALGGMEAASVSVTAKVQVEGAQDGHSPGTWSARRADVEFGAELLLTLEAPHAVRGRVVDDRGTPLAKFVVEMNSTDEGGPSTSQSKPFEAADGAFELQLAAGTYTLSAAADEHGKSEDQSVTLPGTAEVLTFTVPRATSISGTVLDPAGAPIAGASVEIDNEGGRRGMRMARLPDADGSSNKSDEQGHFTLKRIPPGNVALTATLHDFAPSEAQTVAVVAGQPVADVQLKLRLGGRLEGEIYAASGAPDPGRQIMVGNFAGGGGSMDGNATSDSAGHFVVEHVVPGKHNVMAVPKMDQLTGGDGEMDQTTMLSSLKMTMVEILEGQTAHVVLGAPPKAPVRLSGRVTQGGKPYSDGMVMAMADGKSMLESMKIGKLDGNGHYAITLDAPGDYTLIVGEQMGDDHAIEFQETIPEQPEYQLDLAVPLGGMRGRVTGRDGSALKDVPVVLEAEGHGSIFAMDLGRNISTDEEGRFEFKNLKPGTYTLRAGASRMDYFTGAKHEWGIGLRNGIVVEADRVVEGVDLRLDAPGSIEGTVLTADGKPAAKAVVFVRDGEGRLLNPMSSCTTDGLGKFTFDGAPAGTCSVSARGGKLASRESAALHVVAGDKATVELRLEAGTTLRVSVEDAQGKTVRAGLRVLDEGGRDCGSMYGGDMIETMFTEGFSSTEQRIGPLPAGKYKVQATGPDGTSVTKPVSLSGQDERSVRIKLKD